MTFKRDWEKADEQCQLSSETLKNMVRQAFPDKTLHFAQMISGGCANLNIKIQLHEDLQPYILRVYLRDKPAAFREQELANLLKFTVPIPLTYHIGDEQDYRFAITEFLEGITLRDLLLSDMAYPINELLISVGTLLGEISKKTFDKAGFFDEDLKILESISENDYINFAKACLIDKSVQSQLTPDTISKIQFYLEKYSNLFPGSAEKQLVHGDFDPSNILVNQIEGQWKITGIIDWEFAFSGSLLCDVANMLRYAHQMSPIYEEAFLQGLEKAGISLPEHWRIGVHLLNLVSLLDCLVRSDPIHRPKQIVDIRELINHILAQFEIFQD